MAAACAHDHKSRSDDVQRHYITNDDLSNGQVLELCAALTCSQGRFFKQLEQLVSQLSFLREHGCDQMQGFYFSPPVPALAFEKLLRQGKQPIAQVADVRLR